MPASIPHFATLLAISQLQPAEQPQHARMTSCSYASEGSCGWTWARLANAASNIPETRSGIPAAPSSGHPCALRSASEAQWTCRCCRRRQSFVLCGCTALAW
eukprot:15053727-Ditylum_brightwellii.AAC.1